MTIKTEQLKDSIHKLEDHMEKLDKFPKEQLSQTEPAYRELILDILDAQNDCIRIIFSITSEGT